MHVGLGGRGFQANGACSKGRRIKTWGDVARHIRRRRRRRHMNGRDVVEGVSPVGRGRRRHVESRCCASAARDFRTDGRASKQKGGKVGSKAGLLRQPRLCRAEALEGKSWQQGRPMTAAAQSRRQFAQVQSMRLGWEREKSLKGVGKVGSKAGLWRQPRKAESSLHKRTWCCQKAPDAKGGTAAIECAVGQRRCAEPAHGLWGLFILGFPFPEHPSAAARRDTLQRPAVEGPENSSGSKEGPRGSNRYGCSTLF